MTLFENTLKLRGFLGRPAEVPTSDHIRHDSFAVLVLGIVSGTWKTQACEWIPRTEWHRIVCFAKPADYAKGPKKGDYVEVQGELRSTEFDAEVGDGKKKATVKRRGWEIRASIVKKLAQPVSGENLDADSITEDDAA